jgi:hypothetical protein
MSVPSNVMSRLNHGHQTKRTQAFKEMWKKPWKNVAFEYRLPRETPYSSPVVYLPLQPLCFRNTGQFGN